MFLICSYVAQYQNLDYKIGSQLFVMMSAEQRIQEADITEGTGMQRILRTTPCDDYPYVITVYEPNNTYTQYVYLLRRSCSSQARR